ncbi:MAG: hypothetical protein WBL63_07090 [Candidatus Acidiferrum sp.]
MNAASNFRWLDAKVDHKLWSKIHEAFADELTPDDRRVMGPQAAMGYKFIYRVGLHETSALVLIALQRDATTQTEVRFQAYNYDIASERKEAIKDHTSSGVWNLRLEQLARFAPTLVPDVVFQFWDCVACEAKKLLASYRFDVAAKEWRWRNWEMGTSPHTGWTLLIGSSPEQGFDPEEQKPAEYLYQTACAYRIADVNGDGLDDVAVWCREKATAVEAPKRLHSVVDTTLLFTAKDGTAKLLQIKDAAPASALHRQICSIHPQTPPCGSSESSGQTDKSK